ncbi:hypothetical protein Tco_1448769 [Tanacetum coccineum]
MGEAHMCLKSALTYQNPEGLKEKQHQWSSFESKKKMKPRFSKQRFASQVDVNNDLSKPVTTHYLPKERESAIAKPHHMIAPGSSRSYALSWKPCQGDSLNLPDHRIHKDGDGDALFQLKTDSLPHAHAQTTKTYYKHQDSRIMKAQELKTKTYAQTLIYKIFLQRYQVYQGRLLASFQDDAKSKLEYKFQDKENSKDIFSFGSAIEDFICVAFVPNRNIFPIIHQPPQATDTEMLQARENLMETIQAFLKEYDHIPLEEKCMALLLVEERFLKIKQVVEEEPEST